MVRILTPTLHFSPMQPRTEGVLRLTIRTRGAGALQLLGEPDSLDSLVLKDSTSLVRILTPTLHFNPKQPRTEGVLRLTIRTRGAGALQLLGELDSLE